MCRAFENYLLFGNTANICSGGGVGSGSLLPQDKHVTYTHMYITSRHRALMFYTQNTKITVTVPDEK